MKLSILICTIPERKQQFKRLINKLRGQTSVLTAFESVEVVYNDKPKGIITIGKKRNILLNESIGDYICFIDDDDDISNDYIESILKATESNPDCIGFKIDCDMEGKKETAIASLRYKQWDDKIDGFRYVRSIYHKTPVKRDIALRVGFPDISYGEDHVYSIGLQPYLNTEVFIDKVLYFYNYKYENPKTKYGLND